MAPNSKKNDVIERLFPKNNDSATLRVVCPRTEYSASRIAHAVEDCDAHLLNLNITAATPDPDCVAVELRVSIRNAAAVERSLSRYGYYAEVIDGDSDSDAVSAQAVTALQRFLEI